MAGTVSTGKAAVQRAKTDKGLKHHRQPARYHLAGDLLEQFFVAAVVAVLGIRIYLQATGFPQVGGGQLHIAHLLWGGLLMLVAVVLSLTFLGRHIQSWAAILGGLGFGTFIDELGKFITADNDYFYRPAWVIIYIIFILMFFTFTALTRRQHPVGRPALATALDMIQNAVLFGLRKNDRDVILRLLDDSDPDSPLTGSLRRTIADMPLATEQRPGLLVRIQNRIRTWYHAATRTRGFRTGVVGLWLVFTLGAAGVLIAGIVQDPHYSVTSPAIGVVDAVQIGVVLISGVLALIGIISLARRRLMAYQWFRLAILVSLLVGQPLAFYETEIFATGGLVIDLICLGAFNYGISLELADREARTPANDGHNPGFLGAPLNLPG